MNILPFSTLVCLPVSSQVHYTHTLSYISHCFHLCSVMSAVGIGFSRGVHDGSVSIESACSAGDTGDGYRLLGLKDPLEEEMATHFSILAW